MNSDRATNTRDPARLAHGELTGKLIEIFFDVYNELGAGFLESVYAQAFAHVLRSEHIPFQREAYLVVRFRGVPVGACRMDFIVNDAVVVECKAVSALATTHRGQLMNYLRATGLEVGLLLNFGPVPEFKRVVCSPRVSSDPP